MYRLMKSEKFTLDHRVSGRLARFRQSEVTHFQRLLEALEACQVANNEGRSRCYVLNDLGQEFFEGVWID